MLHFPSSSSVNLELRWVAGDQKVYSITHLADFSKYLLSTISSQHGTFIKSQMRSSELASGPLHDLSLGHNTSSALWFIESESGYQEMHLALEECHDSTLP